MTSKVVPSSKNGGKKVPGNGEFDTPAGVVVDPSGNVFVTDVNNERIQKFTNTGTFIRKWGSLGSASIDVTGLKVFESEPS